MTFVDFFAPGPNKADSAQFEEYLIAEQRWIREHVVAYQEAKAKYQDVEWCHLALQTCEDAMLTLHEWKREDQPHFAVHCLATAAMTLQSVFSQLAIIDEFESRQRNLFQIQKGSPEQVAEAIG